MKKLEEEAKKYAVNKRDKKGLTNREFDLAQKDFMAGANSKWVQAKIIEAKIDGLQLAAGDAIGIIYRIMELEEKLKELEDGR